MTRPKPKNFILLVEVLARELAASVLLGAELSARGHNVWLIEKDRFRKSPASFQPSIVLEKGLTKGCLDKYRAIRSAGHVLAVMSQEGFTYRSGDDYIERRVCAETAKYVDYLFFWGEREKQDLSRLVSMVPRSKVTGNPRFDLLHRRFHKSWMAQEMEIKRECGDFVLFTSRFSAVNHFRRSLTQTVDRRKHQYTGRAAESLPRRLALLEQLLAEYVGVIGAMAARFPDVTFIVRPYPMENAELWRAHFKDRANVMIRADGMALPWLSAARCVIHNCCTTGIEAYMLGRPVTEFYSSAVPYSEFDPTLPGEVTGVCESADALAAWIETHMKGEATINSRRMRADELIASHLHNHKEPDAHTHIATALESLQAPGLWAKLRNKMSGEHAPKKMQKRYIDLDEVNALLRAYVACNVRDQFVPAVVDDVGIRLQQRQLNREQNAGTEDSLHGQ